LNLDHIISDLVFIKPELAISVTLVLIILVDLIFSEHKKILPFVSMAGLLVTCFFVIEQFGMSASAFKTSSGAGLIVVDNFGSFFKVIVLFASIIIIFFSINSSEIKLINDRHGEYYTLLFGMILGMFMMSSSAFQPKYKMTVITIRLIYKVLLSLLKNSS